MSTVGSILDALAAELATVTGYTATGAVREGVPTAADLVPGVIWYSLAQVESQRGGRADMVGYARSVEVNLWVTAAAASGSASARVRAALEAAQAAQAVVELSPTVSGYAHDVSLSWSAMDGDELGLTGVGVAVGVLLVQWISDGGTA